MNKIIQVDEEVQRDFITEFISCLLIQVKKTNPELSNSSSQVLQTAETKEDFSGVSKEFNSEFNSTSREFNNDFSDATKELTELKQEERSFNYGENENSKEQLIPSMKADKSEEQIMQFAKTPQISNFSRRTNESTKKIIPRNEIRRVNQPIPLAPPLPNSVDLGKLNFLIRDPQVQGIECPGPDKNVLVRKNGAIQKTQVILTKEEIEYALSSFSEKTRIPLIGNMFNAAYGNLIISSIKSDFAGTRFIVRKKTPNSQLELIGNNSL